MKKLVYEGLVIKYEPIPNGFSLEVDANDKIYQLQIQQPTPILRSDRFITNILGAMFSYSSLLKHKLSFDVVLNNTTGIYDVNSLYAFVHDTHHNYKFK